MSDVSESSATPWHIARKLLAVVVFDSSRSLKLRTLGDVMHIYLVFHGLTRALKFQITKVLETRIQIKMLYYVHW